MNAFDAIVLSLLGVGALPVTSGCAAALWILLIFAATFVLRHGSRERARGLSRATLLPSPERPR